MSQAKDISTTTYYKCVTKDLKSSNANYDTVIKDFEKFLVIQYKIGEFVKPATKGTQLFVFSNLSNAYYFQCEQQSMGRHTHIYTCEVKNPRKNPKIYTYFRDAIEVLKKKKNKKKLPPIWGDVYSSYRGISIGCDEVKLLKRVDTE